MIVHREDNLAVLAWQESPNYRIPAILHIVGEIGMQEKFLCMIDVTSIPLNYTPDANDFPYDEIIALKQEAENRGLRFYTIFECIYEAPTYRYKLSRYIDELEVRSGIARSSVIILSGAQHQFGDPVINCFTPMMSTSENIFKGSSAEILPQRHFVSLARIAKPHRVSATVEILDRGLEPYGLISLGSGYYNSAAENSYGLSNVPERYQHKMPMLIDGIIAPGHLDSNQHKVADPRMNDAYVNVVMETAFDHEISPLTWNVPFISEKSIKPFAWGQVPIYIAPQNSLPRLREMGFDLFDDVVDQDYDKIADPVARITAAISELERICKIHISQHILHKISFMDRFAMNRAKALKLHLHEKHSITIENLRIALDEGVSS
jgi:hypothetical protein